jgi:hypothetical protein
VKARTSEIRNRATPRSWIDAFPPSVARASREDLPDAEPSYRVGEIGPDLLIEVVTYITALRERPIIAADRVDSDCPATPVAGSAFTTFRRREGSRRNVSSGSSVAVSASSPQQDAGVLLRVTVSVRDRRRGCGQPEVARHAAATLRQVMNVVDFTPSVTCTGVLNTATSPSPGSTWRTTRYRSTPDHAH